MRIIFVFCFLYNICFSLTFFDSLLYTISDEFENYIEINPDFKIYSFLINNCIKHMRVKKNTISLIAQKILILSILLEAFCAGKKDISMQYIKKKFDQEFKKKFKMKKFRDNYFSLLIIADAHDRLKKIKNYDNYCKIIAPHWFSEESYFKDNVEYKGPNLKKTIDSKNFIFVNEYLFGPVCFVFIYALTKIVSDSIK